MADKPKGLDVWIVEANTVYREVPYTVVTDWIQQGRLLPDDRVRPSGSGDWKPIGELKALAAFLPRPEPFRAEDQAEALEPVEAGFPARRARGADEDDDPDMIPLIDISLVLLIFFMMTAAVSAGVFAIIDTPPARHQLAVIGEDMYWVGIDVRDEGGKVEKGTDGQPVPIYSVGKGDGQYDFEEGRKLTREPLEVTNRLGKELERATGEVRVRLRADRGLRVEVVQAMTAALQEVEARINAGRKGDRLKVLVFGEVSEPQTP